MATNETRGGGNKVINATFQVQEYALVRIGIRLSYVPLPSSNITLIPGQSISSTAPRVDITLIGTTPSNQVVTLTRNGTAFLMSINETRTYDGPSNVISLQ
jgi:hypothetical protein